MLEFTSPEEFSRHVGPVVTDFSEQLRRRGIDLIFVPTPTPEEVHPETLSPRAPDDCLVSPQRTQLLLALLASDVEVVDLLPSLHEARRQNDETLYFYRDTHWSSRGMRVAASALAERLDRYDFVRNARGRSAPYATRDVEYTRAGNLLGFVREKEKEQFKPLSYNVRLVENADGGPYADVAGAPILLIGDSNLGIPALTEIGGQFSAHVAHEIGMPIDTLWKRGGFVGANVDLARQGPSFLGGRRVVVWIGTGAWLGNTGQWRAVELP